MGRVLRIVAVVLILLALVTGWLAWKSYNKKVDLRSDAILYFKEEDYTKSIQYLQDALAINTVLGGKIDQDIRCYLAESYFRMGDYKEAEKLYHKLQKKEPDHALYYLLEGQCAFASGDSEKAMEIFQKGWEKTRDLAFLSEICEIYIEKKEYDKALDYANQVISAGDEANAELMYDLIIIYEKSQDYQSAYKAAEEYCKKYPDDEKGKKELVFLSSRV